MPQYVKKIRTEAGDLQIDYNSLANLPQVSNQNLLINGDFRNPINQRGKYTYTGSSNPGSWMYTIDRWRVKGLNVTVNDNSITLNNTGSSQNSFQQAIGYYLPNGTYTVSCKVLSITGNVSIGLTGTSNNPKLSIGVNNYTWKDIEIGSVAVALDAGASVELEWIKLENSDIATKFVPRLYTDELVMCQRFYRTYRRFPIYAASSTSLTYMLPIQFGVPMNAANQDITITEILNSSATLQSDVTCTLCLSGPYNAQTIQLSKSIGQFGFVSITFDAEIY